MVTSTQHLSSLCFYLLSICTLSPQQPQQTQQAWNLIPAGTSLSHTQTHVHLSTTASSFQCQSFQSLLTCSAPVPVHHSSHPKLSVRCSKSSSHFCPSLPPSASLTLPHSVSLSLSPCLSLSRFPVAHATETLYLIHYDTSRLTPSQMGDWLLLVLAVGYLTGCSAPPQLLPLPSLLAVHVLHIHVMTRNPELRCFLPSRVKMPCHFRTVHSPGCCFLFFLNVSVPLDIPVSLLSSVQHNSSFSTQPDLCNAISLLAIYGTGCHSNYRLHLSFTHLTRLLYLCLSPSFILSHNP